MLPLAAKVRVLASSEWGRDDGRDRLEHIATARMRHDAGNGARSAIGPEFADGGGGEFGHGAMEKIAELAVALLEPEFIAVGGQVKRVEVEGAQAGGPGRRAPNRGCGAIAEQAGADEDAGIVVR